MPAPPSRSSEIADALFSSISRLNASLDNDIQESSKKYKKSRNIEERVQAMLENHLNQRIPSI
jgi:hypothetical protein